MAITFVASGTVATGANPILIPYPAGISAPPGDGSADALVAWITNTSASALTTPPGWLPGVFNSAGGLTPSTSIFVKVATGSESGSLSVTTGSTVDQARMMLFRGVDATNPIDVASVTAGAGSFSSSTATSAYNIAGLTTTQAGVALVYAGGANSAAGTWNPPTAPSTFTETNDNVVQISSTSGYLIWSGSGATGTINLTRSSSVRGSGGVVALRPFVATAPPRNVRAYNPALNRSYNW